MADRAEFLEHVRERASRGGERGTYAPTRSPDVAWTSGGGARERTEMEDPSACFLEELEALGGKGVRVDNLAEARAYVLSLAREKEAKLLVRWDDPQLQELGVDEPLVESGTEVAVWRGPNVLDLASRADVGLTTAEWGIAETGTVVVAGGQGRGRTATLLPPVHVAILPSERILHTVPDAIERYADGAIPANVAFHSGPSRSGDIEMTLSIGVHGPGEIHVLVVG